jgi:hypothetical protein
VAHRSHRRPGRAGFLGIGVSALVVTGSLACGSGAVEGPDGGGGGAIGIELPVGNETAAAEAGPVEEEVYAAVADGDCSAGQDLLDDDWAGLDSPRAVLLYEGLTAACEGDVATADARLDEALALDAQFTSGTLECIAYQALVGFVGRPPADCSGTGPGPTWPTEVAPGERVDPRTASAIDETTTSDSTTTSSEGPISTPSSPTTDPNSIEAEGDVNVSADG